MDEKPDTEGQQTGRRGKSFWLDQEVIVALESTKKSLGRSESWLVNMVLREKFGLPPTDFKGKDKL